MSDFTRHYPQSRPDGTLDASAGEDATATGPGTASAALAAANISLTLSKLAASGVNLSFKYRGAIGESPARNDEGRRGPPQAARTAT